MAKESKEAAEAAREARISENTEKQKTAVEAEKQADAGTGYVIADGKSIVTRRGVVSEGQAIGPLDFVRSRKDEPQGLERVIDLIEKGYIVDTQASKRRSSK